MAQTAKIEQKDGTIIVSGTIAEVNKTMRNASKKLKEIAGDKDKSEAFKKKVIEENPHLKEYIEKQPINFGGVSGEKLRQIVSKIEKLEEEKKEVAECIKEAFGEAKAHGYDVKVLRQLLKDRKTDQNELFEFNEILKIYKTAMGMISEEG